MSFQQHCQQVVSEYLQTALIIDDQAALGSPPQNNTPITPVNNITDAGSMFSETTPPATTDEAATTVEPVVVVDSHDFDATKATNAFYNKGIIAGLYKPEITENQTAVSFAQTAIKIASRADVIIVDWMLKRAGSSEYSKELIKQVLIEDYVLGGRLRSIIVYTGQQDLSSLRDELLDYLIPNGKLDLISLEANGHFSIQGNNLIIAFYNKKNTVGALESRQKSENELPELALQEYANLVKGIVPAFAMSSAAKIRENIGRIIAKFDGSLDEGYLSHRALLPNTEDSEVFMLENFVSYLRNILAITQVDKQSLNVDIINKWLNENDSIMEKEVTFIDSKGDTPDVKCKFDKAQLERILCLGTIKDKPGLFKELKNNLNRDTAKEIFKVNESTSRFINVFDRSPGSSIRSTKKLAVLTSFRRTADDVLVQTEKPYLTQGTLIKELTTSKYYLCVTPKCDTARVNSNQMFSFTELKISENDSDLILFDKDSDAFISLITSKKFNQLKHINFSGGALRRVIALDSSSRIVFKCLNDTEYEWLGDIEDMEIQKRVSDIVGNFNRIGTDEVEWLRRQ
jgi:hypothetical protein